MPPTRSLAETIAAQDAILSYIPPDIAISDQFSPVVGADLLPLFLEKNKSPSSRSDSLSPNQPYSILLSSEFPLYENGDINQSGDVHHHRSHCGLGSQFCHLI